MGIQMKLAEKILNQLDNTDEAKHFNTKVRALEGKGSRAIRLAVKEAKKMVENMMDPNNSYPNPKNQVDHDMLDETKVLLKQSIDRLKDVKESKYKMKKKFGEEFNGAQLLAMWDSILFGIDIKEIVSELQADEIVTDSQGKSLEKLLKKIFVEGRKTFLKEAPKLLK